LQAKSVLRRTPTCEMRNELKSLRIKAGDPFCGARDEPTGYTAIQNALNT